MNAPPPPGLRLVILAAGFSTRLGSPKPLARIHGRSLLRRTLTVTARLGAREVLIVVPRTHARYRHEAQGFAVEFVVNSNPGRGLSSSLARGVAVARYAQAVLLLPVDLAQLKRRELVLLVARWRGRPRSLVARRLNASAATPLILPRWLFALAHGTFGDAGLRSVINAVPNLPLQLIDMPSAAADVDVREDLRAARARRGVPLDQAPFES